MMKMQKMMMVATVSLSAIGMSGCGAGSKLVKSLNFSATEEGGHLMAGFDAKVELGMGALPEVKLPIYDPKSPARFLGYLETHFDGGITVRVDVTEAAHVKTTDGSLLPNGRDLPLVLPSGVVPIGIPVINSNSKVYLAVGRENIMAGAAVTLLADTSTGSSDWLKILQALPANIFYPFQIAADIKGTAGIFTGEKVGVGIFAIKSLTGGTKPTTTVAATPDFLTSAPKLSLKGYAGEATVSSLAALGGNKPTAKPAAGPEVFGVKTQYPTGYKMYRIQRALGKVRDTKLD